MNNKSAYPQGTRNPKPITLYLLRHARSAANENTSLHHTLADHRVPLTPEGHLQAQQAAEQFLLLLPKSVRKVAVWVSPFLRTRETAKPTVNLLQARGLQVRLHERDELVEQLFGLFDGYDEEEWPTRFPDVWKEYRKWCDHEGKYFAKMPNGESRFDVYNRLQPFTSALHREFRATGTRHHIVVSHGVTLRMLAKLWQKYSVEWAEREPNPANASIRVLDSRIDRGYLFPGFMGNSLELAAKPKDRDIAFFDYGLK